MNYIVLDLEWNQPSWRGAMIEDPVHLVGEIVQIGAVKLNRRFKIKKELRLSVTPRYYRRIHKKVSRITGLTTEDLKKGKTFPEAVKKLKKFCGKDFVFLTWGPDDLPMLFDNLRLFGLSEDWVPEFFDLQVLFAHQIAKEKRQFALELAMEMLGEGEFEAHDALNDARSTALVCRHLDMEQGMKEYALLAGDITIRPLREEELPMGFPDRGSALKELADSPFLCPLCGEYLTPDAPVPQNPHKYLAGATCSCGKRLLVRWKFFRNAKDACRVIREIYPMTDALEIFLKEKTDRFRLIRQKERDKEKAKRRRQKARRAEARAAISEDPSDAKA